MTVAMEIIIVGAGVAGLSAGIGFRRAGHKVTVVFSRSFQLSSFLPASRFPPKCNQLLNKLIEGSRAIVPASRSGSGHHHAPKSVKGPLTMGLQSREVENGRHKYRENLQWRYNGSANLRLPSKY